jgi:hypothetical protein
MSEIERIARRRNDRRHFAALATVLGGRRLVFDGSASKMLMFMLEKPEGCDATIDANAFEVRFGWHPARHRYYLDLAAPVLSKILELAGVTGPIIEGRLSIGPAQVSNTDFVPWSFDRRFVWIASTPETVRILVRAREGESDDETRPDALPDPIEMNPLYLTFPTAAGCPHCQLSAEKYRHLRDGSLVCQSCGRSFNISDLV